MSVNERLYQIDQMLNDRRSVSFKDLQERLEVSPAPLKRDLAYMRNRLNAPIIFDKELCGYRFEKHEVGTRYELPGHVLARLASLLRLTQKVLTRVCVLSAACFKHWDCGPKIVLNLNARPTLITSMVRHPIYSIANLR